MIRVFVVGCSRSGTSVLQRLLVEQFNLWSLPETAFFKNLGYTPTSKADAIALFADILDYGEKVHYNVARRFVRSLYSIAKKCSLKDALEALGSMQRAADVFTAIMDQAAERAGAAGWVEKTPLHCLSISSIVETVPDAVILFVLRQGESVVASIVDRARRYPDRFGYQDDIVTAVNLWNVCIAEADKWKSHPSVHLISYESLTRDMENSLHAISDVVEATRNSGAGANVTNVVKIVGQHEPWKAGVNETIQPAHSKFNEILSEEEKRYAIENLNRLNYRNLLEYILNKRIAYRA